MTIAEPRGLFGPYMTGAAVAATAEGRAWVFVSKVNNELGTYWTDAVEWRGRSWSAVHTFTGGLGGPVASGPDDVWGFGSGNGTPYAVHYNGSSWSRVPIPVRESQASGSAAAGDWVTGTVAGQPQRVEVLHWSKGAWRNAALPTISVPKGEQMFPGLIAAASPASVWATVSVGPATGAGHRTDTVLHWHGRTWSKVPVPKGVSVHGLASDGHGGCWVASYTVDKPGTELSGLVMYHYSGGRWTHVPAPVRSGSVTNVTGGMKLIPRTRSVLAGATLIPAHPSRSEAAIIAILKYGP